MRRDDQVKGFLNKMWTEIGQEAKRMGVQGQAELASAIFTGNAYVPYGQGQHRDENVQGPEGLHQESGQEHGRENDGRSL